MSARGAHGGYWLARPAEEIPMDEVVQALEGAIAPMECFVSEHTGRVLCSHEPDAGRGCATKLLWMRVQGGILRSLQTTTLAELVEFSKRTAPTREPPRSPPPDPDERRICQSYRSGTFTSARARRRSCAAWI